MTGLVMSVLMGFLHKQVSTRNPTQTHMAAMLRGEGDTARTAVPTALAGLVGWFTGTGTTTTVRTETIAPSRQDDNDRKAAFPWLRWLLIGLGLLVTFWLLTRACNRDETKTTTTTTDTTMTSDATAVTTDTVASDINGNGPATGDSARDDTETAGPEVRVAVDLPGGRKLNVAENSFNYSLASFLAAKSGKTPRVFTFDNLTFETNSARITVTAKQNVDDLIQIMRAYPSLTIRIEGNTDSTGPDAVNDPLSAERAQTVLNALVQAGINTNRVTTRERGDSKPVASNQTEAG